MSVVEIRKYPDPRLRKKCKPVVEITPEIYKLIANLIDTMYSESGVGLAASQVGVPLRICVIDVRPGGKNKPYILINPQITKKKGVLMEHEGCLSFPGVSQIVKRARNVRVEAINEKGIPVVIEGDELLGRALQHEIDHLDGKVFIQRMPLWKRIKVLLEIKKRKKAGLW